ncbi:ArsR/SmtB family transcription factor [Catenulispora yoronensis]
MLDQPVSTTELARLLAVTPGAVSQHLKVLSDAGLTARARHGRSVLYVRSPLGNSLAGMSPGMSPGVSQTAASAGQSGEATAEDDAA